MDISQQLQRRKKQTGNKLDQLATVSGVNATNISAVLNGKRDARASTLGALADAMDAQWMLIPKHLLFDVERLLSGGSLAPDTTPSTVDQLFGRGHE